MKILTICPSIYPNKMFNMCNSMNKTKSVHTDYTWSSQGNVTEAINVMFNSNPDYDFYMILNDDIEFKTNLWDLKLANKNKISYGDDLYQSKNMPTFPMIDGDIVRALGWLQLPTLERYAGDVVWKFIGESLGILNYIPEVIIEHKWEGCTHPDINNKDMATFAQWLPWAFKDLQKVRNVLQNKNN